MKKLPILLLSSLLLLGCVVGCGEETPSSTPGSETSQNGGGSNGGTTSQESLIKGVSIVDPGITEVMEGISGVKLDANVDGPSGSKVSWSSSNEDVATVRNGTVSFKKVEENTDVTITATSRDDSTKSDSVTFTVKDCVIDFTRSHGSYDALLFEEEGVIVEAGDSGLMFEEVYGTKWYVEAKVTLNELNDPAGFSKFGIFSGTNENAAWNGSIDANINKNAMFYVDAQKALENGGFNVFNFVGQNDTFTDWDWGNQLGYISVSNDDKVRMDQEFTMGLLRNGVNYYMYLMKGSAINCYKHVRYEGIAADEATYAWIGGWGAGYTARDFKAYVGDEVDALYATPEKLELTASSQVLFVNDTYQINVDLGVIDFDHTKLTFESSDPEVATVDDKGFVVAGEADGETVITVKYGELVATLDLVVTSDPLYNVVLDGKMDDAIWSEQVLANVYQPRNDGKIKLYGTRNSRGLYIFADYTSTENAVGAVHWWEGNNFEMTFTSAKGLLFNAFELSIGANDQNAVQFWTSMHSGTNQHNFSGGYLSDLVKNEETGLYEMAFEMFVSYEDLVQPDKVELVQPDAVIGFGFGAPRDGWQATSGYRNGNLAGCAKITASGIYSGIIPETECNEHVYGNYQVTTPSSCTEDGVETRTCKWCGHPDTRVIEATGEHVWDYNNLTVTTPATCTTEGVGLVPCTGTCGITKDDVAVPVDLHNHSAWDAEAGKCADCGNYLENKVTFSYPANTNWITRNFIPAVMDGSSDWTVEMNIDMIRTNGNKDCARGWAGQVQVENANGEFDDNDANKWVFRQDWWGWGYYNPANGANLPLEQVNKDGNCGSHDADSVFTNGFADYIDSVLDNCNLVQTFSYSATTGIVTVVTKVTAKAGAEAGKVATVTYQSLAFPTGKKMEIGFGMLWNMEGSHVINSVKLTGTVIEGPHTHIGTVGLVA